MVKLHSKSTLSHIIILSISVLITLLFYSEIIKFPGFFVEDDTFFYAQIAYNIGVNGISSFDGVNTTDGYHLIWCWILSILTFITKFFTLDKHIHFMVMLSFYHYLLIWLSIMITKNIYQSIISFFIIIVTAYLMEDVLLSLLIVLALKKAYNREFDIFYWAYLFFIPLVRIDGVVIISSFVFFYLIKEYKMLFASMIVIASGAVTQLVINKLIFDSYFSVSSLIKLDQNRDIISNLLFNIEDSHYFSIMLAVGLYAFTVIMFLMTYKSRKQNRDKNIFLIIVLFSVFCYLIYLYTYTPFIRQWYLTLIKVLSLFVLFDGKMFQYFESKYKYFWHSSSIIMLIIFIYFYTLKYEEINSDNRNTWQFINNVNKIVPEDEKIFQYDASGITGYFTGRTIINGDGLMNTHQYFDLIKKRQLKDYLQDNQIRYIITNRELKKNVVFAWRGLLIKSDQATLLIEPSKHIHYDFCIFRLYKLKE
jgi:hypothetical protein